MLLQLSTIQSGTAGTVRYWFHVLQWPYKLLVIWGQLLDDKVQNLPLFLFILRPTVCELALAMLAECVVVLYIAYKFCHGFASVGSRSLGTLFSLSHCVHYV